MDTHIAREEAMMLKYSDVARDDNTGFCRKCTNEQGDCEPDAEHYTCESCGAKQVFGAEQLLFMYG